MANRTFTRSFYTTHAMPVLIDCNFVVGASGAVGTTKGPGVSAVTRLAAGVYKIKLQDNYNKFYALYSSVIAPVSGAAVAAGSLTPGVLYVIDTLGTTTTAQWVTAGVPVGITPAVGVSFVALAISGGTGTAKAVGTSGIIKVETVGLPDTQLGPIGPATGVIGGYIIVKCLAATAADNTAMIATDPAEGSTVSLAIYLSNSSVVVQGE